MAYQCWKIRKADKDLAAQVSEDHEIDPFLALLLVSRGITEDEQIDAFLHDDGYLSDPFELPGMTAAVKRIRCALDGFEKIAVYGDFDADGVTATAALYSCLSHLGADVMYYIPDREKEGYGLNCEALKKLKEAGVKLVITVDNGIAAVEEAAFLKEHSMDLVITDHHLPPPVLPEACAIIDPHCAEEELEFTDWAGVGVAFKLVCALCGEEDISFVESLTDLVAVGTVADVVPLLGENRTLVNLGLQRINDKSIRRAGIDSLIQKCTKNEQDLSAADIAFTLAPRINAAGRIFRAEKAAELLLLDDPEAAAELADFICEMNVQRQDYEKQIMEELDAMTALQPELLHERVLVFAGEGWHPGVVGIAAARMVERYGKPCILLTYPSGTEDAKGSGRSFEGFSLYNALSACSGLLTRFGGHALAAGLSLPVEGIDAFRAAINAYAGQEFPVMPLPEMILDCKLSPAYISLELLECLAQMEPFGAQNPKPLFGLYQMRLDGVTPIGSGKHLRLQVSKKGVSLQVLRFGVELSAFPYKKGDLIDLAVTLSHNEYQGRVSVSVQAKALRLSGVKEEAFLQESAWYESSLRGEHLSAQMLRSLYPSRERCALVYRFLLTEKGWALPIEELYFRLQPQGLTLGQVYNSIKAFLELKLIRMEESGAYTLCPTAGKVDLEGAPVLVALKARQVS